MKVSIITPFTAKRGDPWKEGLSCYGDFADEIVAVYDFREQEITEFINALGKNIVSIDMDWPWEYSWEEFPRHNNAALEKATGDWVMRMYVDYLIHEKDFVKLRESMELNNYAAITMQKTSIYKDRYYSKGNIVVGLNKKDFPHLRFGQILNQVNDDLDKVVAPLFTDERGVPVGKLPWPIGNSGVALWNFDYTFKTREQCHEQFAQAARAYKRYFSMSLLGQNDAEAIDVFDRLQKARYERTNKTWELKDLPKYIHGRYK